MKMSGGVLEYFSSPALMSNPGPYADLLENLPTDLSELVKVVQGLLVHVFWAKQYGLELSEKSISDLQIRPLHNKLSRLMELDSSPLDQPRPPEHRLVGTSRDFSLLLVSFLRFQGKPARARCGFGTYFISGHYEDLWVAEVWDGEGWRQVDAQMDKLKCRLLNIQFDPLNLPNGTFLNSGQAWSLYIMGKANPKDFGILQMTGLNYLAGNVVRDALALTRIELLPQDDWEGMGTSLEENPSSNAVNRVDNLAFLIRFFDYKPYELWSEVRSNWLPPKDWLD